MNNPEAGSAIPFPYRQLATAMLSTGIVAGTLDGTAAVISYRINSGQDASKIFAYIASAAFGSDALSGGTPMVVAGIVFHFFIALCFSILYYKIYPQIKFLHRNWLLSGLLYGTFVWCVMNLLVVPTSRIGSFPHKMIPMIRGLLIIIFMIGLPISYMANRYYSFRRDTRMK